MYRRQTSRRNRCQCLASIIITWRQSLRPADPVPATEQAWLSRSKCVDELWLPSQFAIETFGSRSLASYALNDALRSKKIAADQMHIIRPFIDGDIFSPESVTVRRLLHRCCTDLAAGSPQDWSSQPKMCSSSLPSSGKFPPLHLCSAETRSRLPRRAMHQRVVQAGIRRLARPDECKPSRRLLSFATRCRRICRNSPQRIGLRCTFSLMRTLMTPRQLASLLGLMSDCVDD